MDSASLRLSAAEQLHELLATDQEISDFLNDLARLAATELSESLPVLCGITLERDKRAAVAGSSSAEAQRLDEIQAGFDEGPCLQAQATQSVIVVDDARLENRWPHYMATVRTHGLQSILAVPLDLNGSAKAALNCYTTAPNAFNAAAIAVAERFAGVLSRALRVALRIARHTEAAEHRRRAMESRTPIDVAVGMIMNQHQCSQDEAFNFLTQLSSNQNIKLKTLAQNMVESMGHPTPTTAFEA